MTTATAGNKALSPEEQAALRYAMLSVYYRSLGSQLETRGAPVITVPPDVRPLSLEQALERLKPYPAYLWEAYWRIVRSVPVESWKRRGLESRYPGALLELLGRKEVERLDEHRRSARDGAYLFIAALLACAANRWPEAKALADRLEDQAGGESVEAQFTQNTELVLGRQAHDFLGWLIHEDRRERTSNELARLQEEVGLNLYDFVEDFTDAVAFADFSRGANGAPMRALNSSCVVRQDTNTLTTTATVTALVNTEFELLARAIDPLCWPCCSDVIEETRYVKGPFDLSPKAYRTRPGQGFKGSRYLFEKVEVYWGDEQIQTGAFENVLLIDKFAVSAEKGTISLDFKLCRSIDSRILWDYRAGGILIDDGFIRARPLGKGRWRVTSRKILKFSDRTPYSNPPGWRDFGQLLNYLAPAAVTWWLETELHTAECMGRDDASKALPTRVKSRKGEANGR
jgi:hypothetical protein